MFRRESFQKFIFSSLMLALALVFFSEKPEYRYPSFLSVIPGLAYKTGNYYNVNVRSSIEIRHLEYLENNVINYKGSKKYETASAVLITRIHQ